MAIMDRRRGAVFALALALLGAGACGDEAPTNSSDSDDDGEEQAENPSESDDDETPGDDDSDGSDDDGEQGDADETPPGSDKPALDAGSTRADSGRPSGSLDARVATPDAMTANSSGDAAKPAGDAGTTPAPSGDRILPPVDKVDADGPFKPMIDTNPMFVVFRPAELGKDGLKHPIFVWGTGSGAAPSSYNDHFNRMASHGFVIVSPNKTQKAAADMKAALDWILMENGRSGSPYHQKLDPDRIGMGGHSQGSIATFDQEVMESRLKTTIHIAGGSFDGRGSSKVKTPTAYICGETDFALSNCRRDWMNVGMQHPTFFSVLKGVDHIQCARQALPGMIAWLRWHLAGETERAKQFTGPDGEFFKGIWGSETKNWKY